MGGRRLAGLAGGHEASLYECVLLTVEYVAQEARLGESEWGKRGRKSKVRRGACHRELGCDGEGRGGGYEVEEMSVVL